MIEHLYEDLSVHLYEGEPITKKAPTPPPITYLTQWKIVGNSEVHGVGNLTSWKVSGNSVVQDGAIMSCGDLGQDGKYHVKISNGVTIFDIPLDAPLRKVNDVADTIEVPSDTEGKALLTRRFRQEYITEYLWIFSDTSKRMYCRISGIKPAPANNVAANILFPTYPTLTNSQSMAHNYGVCVQTDNAVCFYDENYQSDSMINAFKEHIGGSELLYELETPTTELIDVSPFPTSPTYTYTSANVVPYSAFEHTENKEIWSCGEYNATDDKYHILVQPLGGSIVDIALTEPLRKVNNVADTIEFPSGTEGKALVTRNLKNRTMTTSSFSISSSKRFITSYIINPKQITLSEVGNVMIAGLTTYSYDYLYRHYNNEDIYGVCIGNSGILCITDPSFIVAEKITQAFRDFIEGKEVIYELATPTTELVDAPQIAEAESYSMVISQGGKAVSWSSFETND